MDDEKREFLTVWGDTVDFKELLVGLVVGAIAGFVSYYGGLLAIKHLFPQMPQGLMMGYSLLIGVTGCLAVGVVAAIMIKPKRIFKEDDKHIDKAMVLKELNVDLEQEAMVLNSVPADVIAEMHKLGLYELFYGSLNRKGPQ